MFRNLIAKFVGRKIAKSLDLQEGKMEDTKKWYKSKTVLSAIVAVIVATWNTVDVNLGPQFGFDLPNIPDFVFAALAAIGIYGRASADKKLD